MALILIRGTGDVGSAVAHRFFTAGERVVLHDSAAPAHSRRGMAFVNALYERSAELEGVLAKRARSLDDLRKMVQCRRAIPVVDAPLQAVIDTLHPDVLVDARMRKHEQPESQRGLAPLTVGLGPNFEAGRNVDVAIETAWGDDLGAVVRAGRTRDLSGEPQAIAGHARERYVYAPAAGVFRTTLNIGDAVAQGEVVAQVGDTALHAPLTGVLRGLTHDGAPVRQGTKVIEVDPRGLAQTTYGVGERPRRIAQGVLHAAQAVDAPRTAGVAKPFSVGALIGTLGGLIGLGGAEFRLPALVGWFKFGVREAIAMNVLISLVTVAASLTFRAGLHEVTPLLAYGHAVAALIVGSLAGAWIGSDLVKRLSLPGLHRAVAVLLVLLALVMATHAWIPHEGMALTDNATELFALGIVTGVGIGIVGSMLGVAGGELLIPAMVILHGADIKTAGTLALCVSLPMLLLTLWRLSRQPQAQALTRYRSFILAMCAGSLLGAGVGSVFAGIVPGTALTLLLALILLVSAIKTFAK